MYTNAGRRILLVPPRTLWASLSRRLEGICAAAGVAHAALDLDAVTCATSRDTRDDETALFDKCRHRRGRQFELHSAEPTSQCCSVWAP
jgi:hypothetical protein